MEKKSIKQSIYKNIKILFLSILFCTVITGLSAQGNIRFFTPGKVSEFYFFGIGGNMFTDYYKTPVLGYEEAIQSEGFIFYKPVTTFSISLFKIQFDNRINIIQFKDYVSLSANVPISLSFNITESYIRPIPAYVIHLPILLQANFFNNSTKISNYNFGFNIAYGFQYFFYPNLYRQGETFVEGYIGNNLMNVIKTEINFSDRHKQTHSFSCTWGLDAKRVYYSRSFKENADEMVNFFISFNYTQHF